VALIHSILFNNNTGILGIREFNKAAAGWHLAAANNDRVACGGG